MPSSAHQLTGFKHIIYFALVCPFLEYRYRIGSCLASLTYCTKDQLRLVRAGNMLLVYTAFMLKMYITSPIYDYCEIREKCCLLTYVFIQ